MSLDPGSLERTRPLILVVDDDDDNLLLITHIVTQFNCALITATTGQTALTLTRTYVPDLIVLDILLPDISGLTVLQVIRQTVTTATIPIIAVTALAQPEEVALIRAAGANDYLVKPYDLEDLEQLIQQYLS